MQPLYATVACDFFVVRVPPVMEKNRQQLTYHCLGYDCRIGFKTRFKILR